MLTTPGAAKIYDDILPQAAALGKTNIRLDE